MRAILSMKKKGAMEWHLLQEKGLKKSKGREKEIPKRSYYQFTLLT